MSRKQSDTPLCTTGKMSMIQLQQSKTLDK